MSTPPPPTLAQAELSRAARVLVLRSRLEATGLFAGNYRSAFRGGGLEYEESRPYAPGDDVRSLDASATARTGVPYVKIFREERDRTLLLALDASGSMGFGTAGAAKAATAAHALALLASAAGRAGDRIGLVVFDAGVRAEVDLGRGRAQSARVIRIATQLASQCHGPTDLAAEAARWRVQLSRDLRSSGAQCLWLRSDRSPLFALARFFQERAGRRLGGSR